MVVVGKGKGGQTRAMNHTTSTATTHIVDATNLLRTRVCVCAQDARSRLPLRVQEEQAGLQRMVVQERRRALVVAAESGAHASAAPAAPAAAASCLLPTAL